MRGKKTKDEKGEAVANSTIYTLHSKLNKRNARKKD